MKREFTEEHKRKISDALKNRKLSQTHKDNISRSLAGRTKSNDHKEKISNSVKSYYGDFRFLEKLSDEEILKVYSMISYRLLPVLKNVYSMNTKDLSRVTQIIKSKINNK